MTTLYLIRHAEAEGNLYRRIHGWYDALLTENGYRQIEALAGRFADTRLDAVYSSDLFRTRVTAQALAEPRGLEINTLPALREVHMGRWEDLTWGQVYREEGELLALFSASSPQWRAPEGENLEETGRRVEEALRAIAAAHPGQTVAVVCHGMAIRQVTLQARGVPPEQWHTLRHSDNTAVTRLDWDGDAFQVVFEGDNTHLDETLSTLARQSWWRKDASLRPRDVNLWFRTMDPQAEAETYLAARQEAWRTVHGPEPFFDGPGFLRDAAAHAGRMEWGLSAVMAEERFMGVLQLDPLRYETDGAGYLAFCYMTPEARNRALGVQLIGQAVSVFRGMGREFLRLRCASYNHAAQSFYRKYGFYQIGEEQNSRVPLDILEKYIGYHPEKARRGQGEGG